MTIQHDRGVRLACTGTALKLVVHLHVVDVRVEILVGVGAREIYGARRHVGVTVELAVVQPELAVKVAEDKGDVLVEPIGYRRRDILPRIVVPGGDVYVAVVDAGRRLGCGEGLGGKVSGAVVLFEVVLKVEGELVLDEGDGRPTP